MDAAETEVAVGGFEDLPAVFGGGGGGEAGFEAIEDDVGGEEAAECAAEHEAAGSIEFDEAETLDAEPGDDAEDEDDGDFEMVVGHGEREDGGDGAETVEEKSGAARGEAAVEETVVDVAAVGGEDGLATEEAADDGEGGVEEGDGESDEGGGHAEDGGGFLAGENAVAAEEEADEEAAGIAEIDAGGVEVIAQENR